MAKRIAAQHSPDRQRQTFGGAVRSQSRLGIGRTRGVVLTARGKPRRDKPIPPDQPDQQQSNRSTYSSQHASDAFHGPSIPARWASSVISTTSSCDLAPRISGRATNTMSKSSLARTSRSRHAARRIRRARLRSTALPTRRPATEATTPEPGAANSTSRGPLTRLPFERAARTRAPVS